MSLVTSSALILRNDAQKWTRKAAGYTQHPHAVFVEWKQSVSEFTSQLYDILKMPFIIVKKRLWLLGMQEGFCAARKAQHEGYLDAHGDKNTLYFYFLKHH